MVAGRRPGQAALGFSVHTGWASVVAVSGAGTSVAILDRRRLEMIPGGDPGGPPFVYHAARKLPLDAAERLVREFADLSGARAKAALRAAVGELAARKYQVVAGGVVVGDRPLAAPLEAVLGSHALVHAAEGEMFRGAIRGAVQALGIPVIDVRARDLRSRAATALGIPDAKVAEVLAEIGRAAGRPWARDQKDACLAASIALSA